MPKSLLVTEDRINQIITAHPYLSEEEVRDAIGTYLTVEFGAEGIFYGFLSESVLEDSFYVGSPIGNGWVDVSRKRG